MANIERDSLTDLANLQCSICSDSVYFQKTNPVKIQQCNHVFHKECLQGWCSRTNINGCSCPLCREYFNFNRELDSLKRSVRNRIRAAAVDDINNIDYSDDYDEAAKDEIRNQINALKNASGSPSSSLSSSSSSNSRRTRTRRQRVTSATLLEYLRNKLNYFDEFLHEFPGQNQTITRRFKKIARDLGLNEEYEEDVRFIERDYSGWIITTKNQINVSSSTDEAIFGKLYLVQLLSNIFMTYDN